MPSRRSGSTSLAPNPLPPFHGLTTGVGTYSSASHRAMSGTVVVIVSPSGVHAAVAPGSACSPRTRISPRPAR